MPRRKATAIEESFSAEPLADPLPEAPPNGEYIKTPPERKRSDLPDPREWKTVTLGTSNADPKIRLLRSFRYRQMQIRFDRDPDDKYKLMLKEAGWRDRTEEEGIWTKQLPKEGEKWQAAADAEALFKRIANEIRAGKGLGDVMSL